MKIDDDTGGATFHSASLREANRLYITRIDAEVRGDTHFPWRTDDVLKLQAEEFRPKDAKNSYDLTFCTYERIQIQSHETLGVMHKLWHEHRSAERPCELRHYSMLVINCSALKGGLQRRTQWEKVISVLSAAKSSEELTANSNRKAKTKYEDQAVQQA